MSVCRTFALFFFSLFASAAVASPNVSLVAELDHSDYRDFFSVGQAYDIDSSTNCIIVSATRNPGGAATDIHCYQADVTPSVTANNAGAFMHGGDNTNTVFMITDRANAVTCLGSLITRRGTEDQTILTDYAHASKTAAGVGIKLNCKQDI